METQKLGINIIKEDLTAIIRVVSAVDKALEDNKISVIEGLQIAFKSTALIKVVKNLKAAKAELMDLDGGEKAEIAEYFAKEFDLRNDEVEKVIEGVIELAISFSDNLFLLGGLIPKKTE